METQSSKRISSITLSALLLSSLIVIANGSVSHASSANPDEVNMTSGSNRFIVWSDKTPGNWEIFFRRSTDNAATWKPIVNLSNNPGSSLNPAIVVSGSNVYVVWSAYSAGNYEILFRLSTDNGATWKSEKNLSNNAGNSLFPRIGV